MWCVCVQWKRWSIQVEQLLEGNIFQTILTAPISWFLSNHHISQKDIFKTIFVLYTIEISKTRHFCIWKLNFSAQLSLLRFLKAEENLIFRLAQNFNLWACSNMAITSNFQNCQNFHLKDCPAQSLLNFHLYDYSNL